MIWGTLSLGLRRRRSKAQTGIKNSLHAYENDWFNSAYRKARRRGVDQFNRRRIRAFFDFHPVRKGNGACCWKTTRLSCVRARSYDRSVGGSWRRWLNLACYWSARRDDQTDLRHQCWFAWLPDLREFVELSDRKSTRLNSSHIPLSRMPSSA